MQVKKYEAASVIEALKQVKEDLGPDAIILSTQEAKRSVTGAKKFIVVAAVSETQLRKKQLAEKQLETVYKDKVQDQSAMKQKMFIENVYRGIEKKHEARNRRITATPYIDIADGEEASVATPVNPVETPVASGAASSMARVKQAAQEAFKTSLNSDFFKKEEPQEELLDDQVLRAIVNNKPVAPQIPQDVANMVQRLKACGMSAQIIENLKTECLHELGAGARRRALVDSWFAKSILSKVHVNNGPVAEQVEIFVGPHGAGKTSALVKLATHYVMQQQQKVAIITTDLNKVGGVEQLRVYSRILNAPVFVCSHPQDLNKKIEALAGFDKILVDTPGISLSNIEELDFMRSIAHLNSAGGERVHLVISALTKEKDLGGVLKRFRVANFQDVVVTNIDQTSQHGILINIQEIIKKPFHSFGIDSDIVDGFEMASRERVLDLIFKLTKKIGERGNDSRI